MMLCRHSHLGGRECRVLLQPHASSTHKRHSTVSITDESGNARHTSLAASKILVNGLNGGCALPYGGRHSLD
jgi:hypothetical protein